MTGAAPLWWLLAACAVDVVIGEEECAWEVLTPGPGRWTASPAPRVDCVCSEPACDYNGCGAAYSAGEVEVDRDDVSGLVRATPEVVPHADLTAWVVSPFQNYPECCHRDAWAPLWAGTWPAGAPTMAFGPVPVLGPRFNEAPLGPDP